MTWLQDRHGRGLVLLLAPYALGLLLLVFVPALVTFGLSLFAYDFVTPPRFVGAGNYAELLRDDVFRIALRNSLAFVGMAVPLRMLASVGFALLLAPRFRGVGLYRAGAFLPTVVPEAAYALIWVWLLNPLYGPLNLVLRAIGLPGMSWQTDPFSAQLGIVLMALLPLGEGFLVALAARQSISPHLYELAAVESASPWYVLRRVTLPIMAPTLALLLFRDTVYSFQVSFVPAFLVTGGGPPPFSTTYLPLYAYRTAFEFLRFGKAAAATLAIFGVTALIVFLQWRVIRRWRGALDI
jgi:multiple sugar transport system permease protein